MKKDIYSTMTVGDINSQKMGTGARANGNKSRWELMSLKQIAFLLRQNHDIQRLATTVDEAFMFDTLGGFQDGSVDSNYLLKVSVAYNWSKQAENFPAKNMLSSLENVIEVWKYGLDKYAEFNWAKGMPWSVPIGCIGRHVKYHFEGQRLDDESKELHSAHVVCNAMMLVHYQTYWTEGDDRPLFVFVEPKDEVSLIRNAELSTLEPTWISEILL